MFRRTRRLNIANSIVAGNCTDGGARMTSPAPSPSATATTCSAATSPATSRAIARTSPPAPSSPTIDPGTGGGQLAAGGIVPLKNSAANPALSGADPITASATGQLGGTPRPQPAGSLPDIGAVEIKQPLSTSATVNNDVLTGTAAANNLVRPRRQRPASRAWAATTRSMAAPAATCSTAAPATTR